MKIKVGDKVKYIGGGIGELAISVALWEKIEKWTRLEVVDLLDMDDGVKCPIVSYKGIKLPFTPDEVELVKEDTCEEEACEDAREICIEEIMDDMNIWRQRNHNIFKNSEIFWDKFFEEMLNKFN